MTHGLEVLDVRPGPGTPREYRFPAFERWRMPTGLTVLQAHVPGRPLLLAQLVVRGDSGGGATSEPAQLAGVTALTARAMPEGTERRNAVALVEAAERLGAELGTDASWDSLTCSVEVPRSRLDPAMGLLAEMALSPSFPEREVERLRDERLNDLRQARADPRRRVERLFPEVVYATDAAYARPLGGLDETVAAITRDAVVERHRDLLRPEGATLIVCGDLEGVPLRATVEMSFGDWRSGPSQARSGWASDGASAAHPDGPRLVVVDRPDAPQSELRVGHVGVPRRVADFHAIAVLSTLLGGLFDSRLNRLLREQRGYTYGVNCAFDMRRSAGPFVVRCAVQTEATVPALVDIVTELRRVREAPVELTELDATRDYLVGVFPLRFETAAQVGAALAGLVVFGLPDDELDRYRPTIARVTAEEVLAAARAHVRPDEASIAIVGDAARFVDDLEATGLGPVSVVRDDADGGG